MPKGLQWNMCHFTRCVPFGMDTWQDAHCCGGATRKLRDELQYAEIHEDFAQANPGTFSAQGWGYHEAEGAGRRSLARGLVPLCIGLVVGFCIGAPFVYRALWEGPASEHGALGGAGPRFGFGRETSSDAALDEGDTEVTTPNSLQRATNDSQNASAALKHTYDCGAGLKGRAARRREAREWSPEQRAWCCKSQRRGCLHSTAATTAD